MTATATTLPLRRNRSYQVLWISQALSEVGSSASRIAFPLLVLAATGSAAASGLVLGADAAAQLLAGLPAGALADRWDRKKIMLCCEAAQGVAVATLVYALWADIVSITHLVAVAVVMGVCRALFEPAEDACLPRIVPDGQLSTAISMNAARSSLGQLSGTALGGWLFTFGRLAPFLLDLATHAAAFVTLLFLRVPPRERLTPTTANLRREIAEGLRWVWQRPEIRVTALCAITLNLFFYAYYLVIIVLAQSRGVPAAEIGVMAAMLGVGGIIGALIAPYLHRRMRPHVSIMVVFWGVTALTPVATIVESGYVMGALFAAMALLAPTANTTINTHQLLLTPDELRGRLTGAMSVATGTAAAIGPALGGLLMEIVPGNRAVLLCTAGIATVTILITVNRTLRNYPSAYRSENPHPERTST
jgi:MFS family permease